MKKLTLNETADFLLSHDNYAILTHRRPDGDTLGSSAALCRILRNLGKTAHILPNPEITDRFAWLHEGPEVCGRLPAPSVGHQSAAALRS